MSNLVRRGIVFVVALWAALIIAMILSAVCNGEESTTRSVVATAPEGALNPTTDIEDWNVENFAKLGDNFLLLFIVNPDKTSTCTHAILVFQTNFPELFPDFPGLFSYVEGDDLKGLGLRVDSAGNKSYVWDENLKDQATFDKIVGLYNTGFRNPPIITKKTSV